MKAIDKVHMNDLAEQLITALIVERGMSRGQALTAIVTKDSQERHFGRPPLVPGPALAEVYRYEMDAGDPLSVPEAAGVVAFLLNMGSEV